jgi:prepilin-type N-terminal cleavage/methylation domain-containing protein
MLPRITYNKPKRQGGFTLIELLIVATMIGLLAGILVAVINVPFFLGGTRNSRRKVEVKTIADAVFEYTLDKSQYPATITDESTEICNEDALDCTGYIDLSVLTDGEGYLTSIPNDPINENPDGTGYFIEITSSDSSVPAGRIIVKAALAENGEIIETTR